MRIGMAWLREVDRWLIERIIPFASDYRKLAMRLVGPDDADDIVQDAYARLISYDRWREIGNPRAFCLRTIRNVGIDRMRSAEVVHMDRFANIDTIDWIDDRPGPFQIAAGRESLERVLALIDSLPPQCRRVVHLRKIEGRTPHEIAVALGISVSTVETHLAKGLLAVVDGLDGVESGNVVKSHRWVRRQQRR